MIVVKVTGIHQVTGNAENCNFSGIAGNDLNRCDAPALQHKIREKSKRTAAFFANSRLRVVRMRDGGQKRIALDGNEERFVQMKSFFQHTKISTFHRTKANVQQPFLNTACYCELAVQHPFFETSQSCVSTKVTLSHRFKSSPAIPGKVVIPGTAGYLMNAGHFRKSHVSSGDLNRPRSPEVRKPLVCFLVLFAQRKKHEKRSLRRKFRVFSNLESAHRSRSFAPQQLKPFKEAPRFCKPRISAPQPPLRGTFPAALPPTPPP